MTEITARIERRVRAEWPGVRHFDRHGETIIAPVRPGGATDALIKLMAQIVEQEVAPLIKGKVALEDKVWDLLRRVHEYDVWEKEPEDG